MLLLLSGMSPRADEVHQLTPEPAPGVYNFVSHYRVEVNAPVETVWPVLADLKSWMYDFDLTSLSGGAGEPGQVLNLYESQNFRIQVTASVPNRLLTIVNLPNTFQGEAGTGVGVFTLHRVAGGTEVSFTMSRRYEWSGDDNNPLRKRRASPEFHEQTRAMWQDRFLARLKHLAEQRVAQKPDNRRN